MKYEGLRPGPGLNPLANIVLTATLLTPNGGYASAIYTTTRAIAPAGTVYFASYIDDSTPISASVPFDPNHLLLCANHRPQARHVDGKSLRAI